MSIWFGKVGEGFGQMNYPRMVWTEETVQVCSLSGLRQDGVDHGSISINRASQSVLPPPAQSTFAPAVPPSAWINSAKISGGLQGFHATPRTCCRYLLVSAFSFPAFLRFKQPALFGLAKFASRCFKQPGYAMTPGRTAIKGLLRAFVLPTATRRIVLHGTLSWLCK